MSFWMADVSATIPKGIVEIPTAKSIVSRRSTAKTWSKEMSLNGPGHAAMKEYFTSALVQQKTTLPQPLNYLLQQLGKEETVDKC